MPASVKVTGEARLRSTLDRAIRQIPEMDTSEAAGVIASRIPSTAPRLTGRLAGSFTAGMQDKRGTITTPVVYAVPIHWGRPAHNIAANPFVIRAADAAESQVNAALDRAGQKICDGVQGA